MRSDVYQSWLARLGCLLVVLCYRCRNYLQNVDTDGRDIRDDSVFVFNRVSSQIRLTDKIRSRAKSNNAIGYRPCALRGRFELLHTFCCGVEVDRCCVECALWVEVVGQDSHIHSLPLFGGSNVIIGYNFNGIDHWFCGYINGYVSHVRLHASIVFDGITHDRHAFEIGSGFIGDGAIRY